MRIKKDFNDFLLHFNGGYYRGEGEDELKFGILPYTDEVGYYGYIKNKNKHMFFELNNPDQWIDFSDTFELLTGDFITAVIGNLNNIPVEVVDDLIEEYIVDFD